MMANHALIDKKSRGRAVGLESAQEWLAALNDCLTDRWDIYSTPAYCGLYQKEGVQVQCFIFKSPEGTVIYPFLKTNIGMIVDYPVSTETYDVEGVYGYNGIIASNDSLELKEAFSRAWMDFVRDENIVSEFIRFNPVYENHLWAEHVDVIQVGENIVVDLGLSEEELWTNSFEHAVRKNVKRAVKEGLTIKFVSGQDIEPWVSTFQRIYQSTLERHSANDFYYFDNKYFLELGKNLKDNCTFVFVLLDNKAISCELVLHSHLTAYSFLGGTVEEYFAIRPNNFLKYHAILYLKKKGFRYFCLGGGSKPGDGIFKYKHSFAKDGVRDFYIGKKVHNQKHYDELCARWAKKYPDKVEVNKNILLKYRT